MDYATSQDFCVENGHGFVPFFFSHRLLYAENAAEVMLRIWILFRVFRTRKESITPFPR